MICDIKTVSWTLCYCLHVQVTKDLEIKAYYAGHVLGAAMFLVKVGDQSVVYTVSELYAIFSLLACLYLAVRACTHILFVSLF